MNLKPSLLLAITMLAGGLTSQAQSEVRLLPKEIRLFDIPSRAEIYNYVPSDTLLLPDSLAVDSIMTIDGFRVWPEYEKVLPAVEGPVVEEIFLPLNYFRPVVFDKLHILDSLNVNNFQPSYDPAGSKAFKWLDDDAFQYALIRHARQYFVLHSPDEVIYVESKLPEPPRKFTASVDPETAKIVIAEVPKANDAPKEKIEVEYERKHWLKTFNGALQFSQAYVSPNWYQGGNNNLNMLANIYYNVKLNPAFHPNLLFETTFQYKLGINNAPDDKVHDYNISDDLFQYNMLFGYKASKRWYYSTNVTFKTQLLNNYPPNSNDMKASFLSPGELNVGVGMTYNFVNSKKTFKFDASISPVSLNMKTCVNNNIDETNYGIKEGRHIVNEVGSNAEGKLTWDICDNINLRSRLFVFSDYSYIQSDWENTISFAINRFLSTQIYVHMRYDSSTPPVTDRETKWHKLQLKEILSFGFAYNFSTKKS